MLLNILQFVGQSPENAEPSGLTSVVSRLRNLVLYAVWLQEDKKGHDLTSVIETCWSKQPQAWFHPVAKTFSLGICLSPLFSSAVLEVVLTLRQALPWLASPRKEGVRAQLHWPSSGHIPIPQLAAGMQPESCVHPGHEQKGQRTQIVRTERVWGKKHPKRKTEGLLPGGESGR